MTGPANRVVLITGAAGNLGQAAAHAFIRDGARTVLIDRGKGRLAGLFPQLTDPHHMLAEKTDVSDASAASELVGRVRDRFGRIDALVNTVGTYRGGKPVHEEEMETWELLWRANLLTTVTMCRAVVPTMRDAGRGKIVNVAARAALAGGAGAAAYSASKSAVVRLTESLAAELKASDIQVNCVLPGTIDTPQNRQAMPDADRSRWVAPAAIADVILFLASDAARAVTGAALPVLGSG